MKLSESILPEYDQETAKTRKVLERVPEDKLAWKPHPKSFTLAALATHIAMIPGWGAMILEGTSFDVAARGASTPAPAPGSREELLTLFIGNAAKFRKAFAAADDAQLLTPWSLRHGEQTIFTMPRVAVVRTMIISHTIHHRAQLGVYLRLNEVPVPAVYGPSADEPAS